ncbi:diguanylate cyclase [Bowmanella yangjiangensis]|uniref:diguanylate cyclase n=1 Tax=Bowmanella yangjiangensis TaxID=2811230 RepID=A0ABS3CMW5_9ALTE|nr:diguanylate cyclase [Bowmanella yangjiangensis]MBN7818448.1 diguanylate cyclase [Bowmanella yangjiangensis]
MDLSSHQEMDDLHWKLDLLDSIEVGIVVIDRQFRVKVWNEFMHNHSGIQPDSIRHQCLFDYFDEIDQDWFRQKTEPVFTLKSPAFVIWEQRPYLFRFTSYRPVTSASDVMYQNITLFPLASRSDEAEHLCVVVYDVTDEVISKQRLASANQQLRQMSRVDGLTGLYNRRYWEESCEQEFKRCMRNQGTSSVVLLDIDYFKNINDTYGHPAGDQVIRTLAKAIRQIVRETDLAGRYGGEEFALVLPDTSAEAALQVAERIREFVQKQAVVYEEHSIPFTISLGICQFNPSFKGYMAWIEQADKALYTAKDSGRNNSQIQGR